MEVKIERPPNFLEIAKVFPLVRDTKGILYCWGSYIYSPDNIAIPDPLIVHEETHSKQQTNDGPEKWWELYLRHPELRFNWELRAHQEEYRRAIKDIKDRNQRNLYLVSTARRLSGPLYGSCVSYPEALKLIQKGV